MPRELIALEPGTPELREYSDGPLPDGCVRVRVEFGAPKHGTELTMYRGESPFAHSVYDDGLKAFVRAENPPVSPAGRPRLKARHCATFS